jgi:PAS domain S-box-containing protein
MPTNTSTQTRLLWLVLSMALPFSGLLIWLQSESEQAAEQAVYSRLSSIAGGRAAFAAHFFEAQKNVLALMAQRPGIRRLDPGQCDPIIKTYPELHPEFTNMALRQSDGVVLCSYLPTTAKMMTAAAIEVLGIGPNAAPANVSNVFTGPAFGRKVIGVTHQVLDASGEATAFLVIGNDLLRLNEHMFHGLPQDVTIGIFDRTETLVFRSREPEKWIGQPIAPANRGKYNHQLNGQAVITAVDGVRRMYAWTTIPGLGWRVTAGVPEDEAMGPYWQARNTAAGLVAAMLLVAMALAYRLARSINRPVSQLADVTRRMVDGDLSSRAAVSGPRELRALATQFNAMLDVRSKVLADLRDSEMRWRFAIEGAGDGLWDWDVASGTVFFSPRWKTMLGYTEAEVGNALTEWSSRVHPDDMAAVMADLQPHLDGTTSQYVSEHRVLCKDGSYKWMLARGLVVARDTDGKPLRVVGTHHDITQRKREQDALRRSEDQYRELLNVSPVPCALNDEAHNITFLNRAFMETFGYTVEDIPHLEAWWPRAYPDPQYRAWVANTWQARMDAMVASGKPFEPLELRIQCKDGSVCTALVSPAQLSNQTEGLHLVVLVDITARKVAELAVREADRRLRDLMDSTDGIVWEADAVTFTFNSISPNAERMLGYPVADWLQPGFWASHIHPEDHDDAVQYCVACTGRLENHDFEYRYITADNRTVWLRDIVKVVSEDGKPRWLRGLMIDITQSRKDAETLRTNTALLEYTQAAAKVGGWELTIATGHLYWTAETYRIHETSPAEFNPTVDAGVSYFVPESREKITEALGLALEQGQGYALELQTYTTKGSLIDVYTTCTVSFTDGKPAKLTGIFQDITAQKRIQTDLQASLRDKVALLKEVHHRVKNNLQVITSLLRMEARRSLVPEATDVLKTMQSRIHAMAQLHESLYRSGTFASVDLGAYLGQIATQAFRAQLLSAQRVELKLNMASLQVGMDQAIACGLLVNELVSNCLKHGFPDARPGHICVELLPADPDTVETDALWQLRVSDTGVGLSPDFEDKRKNSLGLILVEDLSQQVGGHLTMASQPGAGAEFSVRFKALDPVALVMPS